MSYAIPADAILEIRIAGTLNGQQTRNVFHYRAPDDVADGAAACGNALIFFNDNIWPVFASGMSVDWKDVKIEAQWVYPIRYVYQFMVADPEDGDLTGVATPSGVSVVVRRLTDLAGRSYRGRIYLPGLRTIDVTASQVSNAWYTTYGGTFANQMSAGVELDITTIAPPVLWSHVAPTSSTLIVAGYTDRVLRYQRRREIGKGQ